MEMKRTFGFDWAAPQTAPIMHRSEMSLII